MELTEIRKYLDTFDKAIRYLVLQRISLIPLVAKTKLEKNMQMHQPGREEQMNKEMKLFCENAGINTDLLIDIYKSIIKESLRIEYIMENEYKSNNMNLNNTLLHNEIDFDKSITDLNNIIHEFNEKFEQLTLEPTISKQLTSYYEKEIEK